MYINKMEINISISIVKLYIIKYFLPILIPGAYKL